jgi:membrane-associated HD superfamily phosphohydrolase
MSTMNTVVLIGTSSLIFQIAVLFLLFYGYLAKRKLNYRKHGTVMATAVALHAITIFALMIPSFAIVVQPKYILAAPPSLPSILGLIHGITGIFAFALGIWLVAAWRFRDVGGCFKRKGFMWGTLAAWGFAMVFGIILFAAFYGPLLIG